MKKLSVITLKKSWIILGSIFIVLLIAIIVGISIKSHLEYNSGIAMEDIENNSQEKENYGATYENKNNSIVGTWVLEKIRDKDLEQIYGKDKYHQEITFYSDGSVYNSKDKQMVRYVTAESGSIRITYEGARGEVYNYYKIENDKLYISSYPIDSLNKSDISYTYRRK